MWTNFSRTTFFFFNCQLSHVLSSSGLSREVTSLFWHTAKPNWIGFFSRMDGGLLTFYSILEIESWQIQHSPTGMSENLFLLSEVKSTPLLVTPSAFGLTLCHVYWDSTTTTARDTTCNHPRTIATAFPSLIPGQPSNNILTRAGYWPLEPLARLKTFHFDLASGLLFHCGNWWLQTHCAFDSEFLLPLQ